MKWLLFTDGKGNEYRLNEQLATYILSLLDPQSRFKALRVNKEWKECVKLTERYLQLLPSIRSIPMFSIVALDVLSLKLMTGGMTNVTCSVVTPDRAKWVVRLPGDVSLFAVSRAHEKHNAEQASRLGINVPIVYFDAATGIQVTKLIEGILPLDKQAMQRHELLKALATIAKQEHCSEKFLNETHVFERNENLLLDLKRKGFALPDGGAFIEERMIGLKKLFAAFKIEMSPCHNDLTPSNYMLSYEGTPKQEVIRMIDWEYSSNNDFLWDLAYFVIEAKLTKEQEHMFLSAYFGDEQALEPVLPWYNAYYSVVQWWITLWSWTQLAAGANAVDRSEYEALGKERYEKTLAHLQSREFSEAVEAIEKSRDASLALTPRPF